MNEEEIGRLVTRLIADVQPYLQGMQQAQTAAKDTADVVAAQSARIESFSTTLAGWAGTAGKAMAGLGAAGFLKSAFGSFMETETNLIKLGAAVEMNGGNVEQTVKAYQSFADAMKRTTGASKEDTIALLRKAESYGLTGAAAEQAAEQAIGLAAISDREANALLRMTAAIAQGDVKRAMGMGRLVPQLAGIHNQTEFLAKAQQLSTTGMKTAGAVMNSTEGVMKRFHGTVKALTKQFGEATAEAVKPVVQWMTELLQTFTKLDPVSKKIIVNAAFLVAGILALGPAFKTASFFAGLLFTPINLAVGAAILAVSIWVQKMGGIGNAWRYLKGVVGDFASSAVKAIGEFIGQNKALFLAIGAVAAVVAIVALAFKAVSVVLGLLNLLYVGLKINQVVNLALWVASTVAVFAWTGAVLVAKAALWLLNAALATANVLLIGGAFAFVAVGVLALGTGFLVVGAAVWGAFKAGQALFTTLATIPTTSGPLAAIGAIFAEWGNVIGLVVRAAKVDLPLAGRVVQAGWELAVSQVRDLWPPLWSYIKAGFSALADLVAVTFELEFSRALNNMGAKLEKMGDVFGIKTKRIDADTKALNEATDAAIASRLTLAERNLADAAKAFGVTESAGTRAARATLEGLKKEIGDAEERAKNPPPRHQDLIYHVKFDAAQYGSVEAISRFLAQVHMGRIDTEIGAPPAVSRPAVGAATPDAIRREAEAAFGGARGLGLLGDIRDDIRTMARAPGLEVEAAGFA